MVDRNESRYRGLLAEFDQPRPLIEAASRVREEGYRSFDAFTPYPIEELNEVVAGHASKLPWIVFAGGLLGAVCGFALQYWSTVIEYPMNIGGRPLNSWPAFIVPTFETTILFAGFSTVLGMFALNGLPRPHHPVFGVESFALASKDRFFLYVESHDPRFDQQATRALLESLGAKDVSDVFDD